MEIVDTELALVMMTEAGRVDIPGPCEKAVLMEIKNLGTHGALDTCLVNNQWAIAGGNSEIPGIFFQPNERDKTDYIISWQPLATDFQVLFIFKLYK